MKKKSKIFLGILLLIFIVLGLVGIINQRKIEEKFYSCMPKEVEQIGVISLEYYLEKDFNKVVSLFVDELNKEQFYQSFVDITNFLDELDEYKGREYIGYYLNNTNGQEIHTVTMEIDYTNKFIIYQYIVKNIHGNYKLIRTDFNESNVSLREINRFTFVDKGIGHYIVLLMSIIIFLFSVVTASIAFGSDKKRRILWSFFALCGIGAFNYVWTTGTWDFSFTSIGFPVAGFSRSGSYASFIINMRIPIGAILYWLIKHRTVENDAINKSNKEEQIT